jgi:hypothetical protein
MRCVLSMAGSEETIDVTPMGPVQRSLGTAGDAVVLRIPAEGTGSWPSSFTDQGDYTLTLDADGDGGGVELAGYRLRARRHAEHGVPLAGGAGGAATPATELIMLDTAIRWWREGRGGMISRGVLNQLDENGFVDTDASTYLTTQDLCNAALDDLGVPYAACPASINLAADGSAIPAPGPLDWGNARAITELEALTMRVGYALSWGIDAVLRIVRLARAGDPLTLSGPLAALADPYTPDEGPGIRGSTILVTSGATRTTAIQERALDELEWVAFDERTNTWLNQTDFDTLYPGEIGPEDLTRFRAGLTGPQTSPQAAKQYAQIFTALALKSGDGEGGPGDRERCSMFVNIPSEVESGGLAEFRGTAGVVEARVCLDLGSEQFRNFPIGVEDAPVRIEGLKAIPREGVFVLPADAVYARVGTGVTGRRGDLNALGADDLTIVFAHESNTGQETLDFGIWGFTLDTSGATPALLPLDAAEVLAAYSDPEIVKVHQPYLRRIVLRATAGPIFTDTPLNDDLLEVLAGQIAWTKIAEDRLTSAVVPLAGLVAVNPGDEGGQVSRVVWDHTRLMTYLFLGQHERPGSEEEMRRRAAGDSIAAGVGTVQLQRSSTSLADARAQATADRVVGHVGPGSPGANAVQRGQERATAGVGAAKGEGPQPGEGLAKLRELTTIKALLNPAEMPPVAISANRWEYDWEEVALNGRDFDSAGAMRKSSTHGKALNLCEAMNAATGMLGNGVEVDNIPAGWSLVAIGPRVVTLEGPHWDADEGDWVWYFEATNMVDGSCAEPVEPEA